MSQGKGPGVRPVWVLTGMSGAGKAAAVRHLEAAGIECIDNLPVRLLPEVVDGSLPGPLLAVIDARRGPELSDFPKVQPPALSVLFLDADDSVLVRRLADSTRPHPCGAGGASLAAVRAEREVITPLRAAADVVIDTSQLTELELGQRVVELVAASRPSADLAITLSSFGYKFGAQSEADWLLDSRVLPNPFWVKELRPLTGLDAPVREYVMSQEASREFVERLTDLLAWVAGTARQRGRRSIHVAVGCTGGRHRSVVIAAELAERLGQRGVEATVRHRDVERPDPR